MNTVSTIVRSLTLAGLTTLGMTLAVSPAPVQAAQATTFIALANTGQEVPAGSGTGVGIGYFTLGSDDKLCVSFTFGGLAGTLAAAHIHGPTVPGVNAAILFPLPTANPINTCVGPLDKDQKKDLRRGLYYINVHTSTVPAGEIRGQIEPIRK
ncbi:MAG: CHRD domain-containing protein [Deltaproteobacteria bacterium]|nr:CHRD domain-containing protein [Deltaproteobacteria bacterium]